MKNVSHLNEIIDKRIDHLVISDGVESEVKLKLSSSSDKKYRDRLDKYQSAMIDVIADSNAMNEAERYHASTMEDPTGKVATRWIRVKNRALEKKNIKNTGELPVDKYNDVLKWLCDDAEDDRKIYGEAVTTAKKGRSVLISDDHDIKMLSDIAPETLEIVGSEDVQE